MSGKSGKGQGRHVVHISTVHSAIDPRIRLKELRSAAEHGFVATLVTTDSDAAELNDGVRIEIVRPSGAGRIGRMFWTAPRAVFRAFGLSADIYHIHDPELVPWGWLLLTKGVPVVYDIHEDYVTAIRQKSYLPGFVRTLFAAVVSVLERFATQPFHRVIAERYYRRRFPGALPILNYPFREMSMERASYAEGSRKVIYTGNVSIDRGAMELAALAAKRPDLEVLVIGRCAPLLAERMTGVADEKARLVLTGAGRYVPFGEIMAEYRKGGLLAGLALFPETEHYREKELTKFFEYMAVGLPVVASDFPVWRRLIADNGVGLCVRHGDIGEVGSALDWLRDNPRKAALMSERGRRLVRERFNWEGEGERLAGYYTKIMNG